MLRGNERKKIFRDDGDRQKFIDIIQKKQSEVEISFYAYCLMDNHIHLVLKENNNEISLIMKGIATSYAMYFNLKYGRVGHVFQDRFKSEAVKYMEKNWSGTNRDEIISDKNTRNEVIRNLRRQTRLPIVSIARLLGVNRGVVERVKLGQRWEGP